MRCTHREYGTEDKRLVIGSVAPENIARYQAKLDKWQGKLSQGIANSENGGIINIGDENMGLSLEIDKFTPCLLRKSTGEIVNTNYSIAGKNELKALNKKVGNLIGAVRI